MKSLLLAILVFSISFASARTFRSADGETSFQGEFIRYNAKKKLVTISKSGSRYTTKASNFSEEDQAYFVKAQKKLDKASSLRLKIGSGDREMVEKITGIYTFKSKTNPITFEIRNTSDSDFENLTLKYWVVVNRDKGGKKTPELIEGSKPLELIEARAKREITGPEVLLTQGCTTQASCPKCHAHAAAFGKDSYVGTRVEILDAGGQILSSKSSNNRIDDFIREAALNSN